MSDGATRPVVGSSCFRDDGYVSSPADQCFEDVQLFLRVTVTWSTISPMAMPALLITGVTFSLLYEEGPKYSSGMSMGNLCSVILVLREPMYFVYSVTDLGLIILPANSFGAFSVASRMCHMALELSAKILAPILRYS